MHEEDRREIYRMVRQGISVDSLARRFGRSRNSIYRIAAETRAEILLELPIEFMHSDEFPVAGAEAEILGVPPESQKARRTKAPHGRHAYMAAKNQ